MDLSGSTQYGSKGNNGFLGDSLIVVKEEPQEYVESGYAVLSSQSPSTTPKKSRQASPANKSPGTDTRSLRIKTEFTPMCVKSEIMPIASQADDSTIKTEPVKAKRKPAKTTKEPVKAEQKVKGELKQELLTELVPERKKRDRFRGMSEEEVLTRLLPDHLAPNLDIVIIGINPGLTAAYVGHHYAGPGNHFWKCLYLAGFIPEPMNAYDDYKLTQFGIGFTNIVPRTTRGSADLSRKEIKEGADTLTEKILSYAPKIAVFNGKGIYEVFCGNKNFHFGKQPEPFPGTSVTVFVMPSSSARCTQLPRAVDKVPFYQALRRLRDHLRGDLLTLDDADVTFPDLELKTAVKVKPEGDESEMKLEGEVKMKRGVKTEGGGIKSEAGVPNPPPTTGRRRKAETATVVKTEGETEGSVEPPTTPKKRGRPPGSKNLKTVKAEMHCERPLDNSKVSENSAEPVIKLEPMEFPMKPKRGRKLKPKPSVAGISVASIPISESRILPESSIRVQQKSYTALTPMPPNGFREPIGSSQLEPVAQVKQEVMDSEPIFGQDLFPPAVGSSASASFVSRWLESSPFETSRPAVDSLTSSNWDPDSLASDSLNASIMATRSLTVGSVASNEFGDTVSPFFSGRSEGEMFRGPPVCGPGFGGHYGALTRPFTSGHPGTNSHFSDHHGTSGQFNGHSGTRGQFNGHAAGAVYGYSDVAVALSRFRYYPQAAPAVNGYPPTSNSAASSHPSTSHRK